MAGTKQYSYDFNDSKDLIRNILNSKITKDGVIGWIKDNNKYIDEIRKLKKRKNRTAIINLNSKLLEFVHSLYSDDETDNKKVIINNQATQICLI